MKVVFAGTPEFASVALRAIVGAGHEVVLVLAQPDRPAGRGLRVEPGPVKAVAIEHGLAIAQPRGLRLGGRFDADAREMHERLHGTPHDVMVVAAYGLLLPQSILDIPSLGCMNIHASLLPRWRGAAPVQRAIEAGDTETGVTIMQMDAGLDTGAALLMKSIAIGADETGGSLTARLAGLGAEAIVEALPLHASGALVATPQSALGGDAAATYANKVVKTEASLDFATASRAIVDRIRAFDPWPGCTAAAEKGAGHAPPRYKVWRAEAVAPQVASSVFADADGPGTVRVARDRPLVRTLDGAVALTELQKPGGKRLAASHFIADFASRSMRFVADPRLT